MNENLQIFKHIEIEKNKGTYKTFSNASILLTGNYLIVITKEYFDNQELSISNIFNLSEIKSYKTK